MKYVPINFVTESPPDTVPVADLKKVVQWKFDAFSGVFQNSTLVEVTDFFAITNITEGFWLDAAPSISSCAYGNVVRFVFNFIVFEVRLYEFQAALSALKLEGDQKLDRVTDYEFSTIRVSMNGKGLDYLRSIKVPVEDLLTVQHPKMHPTRIDIAFDFYNYGNEFLDRLCQFATQRSVNLTPTGLLSCLGVPGGISFVAKNGANETTFYFGSKNSNKMLRIYDKYKERVNAGHGIFNETIRYQSSADKEPELLQVSTWLRFEWQLRGGDAVEKLYSEYRGCYGTAILKQIWEYYQIKRYNAVKPVKFWREFFDPSQYEGNVYKILILYNSQDYVSARIRLENSVESRLNSLLAYVLVGKDPGKLIDKLQSYFRFLNTPQDDDINENLRLAYRAKLCKTLCECSPDGRLDSVIKLSSDRQTFIFDWGDMHV